MSSIRSELRIGWRTLRRDRTYALPVLLTLTLCLAANAVVFTVVDRVVLRPLPLPDPERLVAVYNSYPKAGVEVADDSVPDYFDRRDGIAAFEQVALWDERGRNIGSGEAAQRLTGIATTPELFRILRARPLRGRILGEGDTVPGQDRVVLLGYPLWRRLFGGDPRVVGRDLMVNGVPHRIVGVLPRDFVFLDPDVQFFLPLAFSPDDRADSQRHSNSYQMLARLRPGATIEQARQQLAALDAVNLQRFPALAALLREAGFHTVARPLQEHVVADVRNTLYLLWGGVLFVLLIGCVNVTNLALVRATSRAREVAARQALGGSPWRLLRQHLVEGLTLTLAAGAAGLLLATGALALLRGDSLPSIPRAHEIALGLPTLAGVLLLCLAVAALLALVPMLHGARGSVARTLREEGRSGTASRSTRSLRRALVAAQVGFAFVLLLGAGLLLASFRELLRVRPGFQPEGVLTARLSLPGASYADDDALRTFAQRALAGVRALPGVRAAALASGVPLTGSYSDSVVVPEGQQPKPISPARMIVTPGYLAALGVPLLRGRALDERDTATSLPVTLVDHRLADIFWPGQDPVGRRIMVPESAADLVHPGPKARYVTVVGVVGDVKQRGLASHEERRGAYYFPFGQQPERGLTLVVRTASDPAALVPALRRQMAAVDAGLPLYDVQTMGARIAQSVADRRIAMTLAAGFAVIALLLATVGIYGVLAYQVTQRRREIGIRLALGSEGRQVFALVLREGAALLGIGLVLGAGGLYAVRGALTSQLFGVSAFDPAVLAGVTALLAIVGLLASVLPARRAAATDPAVALTD